MTSKNILLFFILLFLGGNIVSQAQIEFTDEEKKWLKEHPVIHFGYEPNWPPFEMYNKGEYTGIVADYIKIIEEQTGVNMIPVPNISWSETLAKLQSGKIHVVPIISITEERKKYLEFTETYISDPLVIVTRDNYQFIGGISDLEGKIVTLPEGFKRVSVIKRDFPKINVITSKNAKVCLLDVSTSKADAFVGSLSVVSYYVNDLGFSNLKIASPTKYENANLSFAVTKDWIVFRNIVQKVLNGMSKSNHGAIRNNWITIRYEHGIDGKQLRNYIIYGILSFLLIISIFYFWNITLRKQIRIREKVEEDLRLSLNLIKEKNIEKETLLKEVHHRVKNNLQIVYSMLNMQSRQVDNKSALKVLTEGKSRVMAMALIHKVLYESENLDKVDISNYIYALLHNITKLYYNNEVKVAVNTKGIILNLDVAIPLGLILSELLTNSYKHAFIDNALGEVSITIEKLKGKHYFVYADNGKGMPHEDIETYQSLGMRLVKRLAHQMNAEAVLKNKNGIEVAFNF